MTVKRRRYRATGMTLIEMLVVVAILGILIGLLFPAFFAVQEKGDRTECLSNVRQIAQAAVNQFEELGDRLPARSDAGEYGEGAENLLPYVRHVVEIFNCPSNPGNDSYGNCEMPNHDFYVEYELNGFLCSTPTTQYRRQSMITDYSKAAYAYDYPYYPEDLMAHLEGVNVGYLDGHAAWLPETEMGDVASSGDDGSEFYTKGHPFWQNIW